MRRSRADALSSSSAAADEDEGGPATVDAADTAAATKIQSLVRDKQARGKNPPNKGDDKEEGRDGREEN